MNMSRFIGMLSCFCLISFLVSCGINDKESYLKSFEDFIVDIEMEKSISSEELTSIKKKYLDFTETYYNKYEKELSVSEEEMILELKTRYYAVMAKQGIKDIGETIKELGEQASEFINDILE